MMATGTYRRFAAAVLTALALAVTAGITPAAAAATPTTPTPTPSHRLGSGAGQSAQTGHATTTAGQAGPRSAPSTAHPRTASQGGGPERARTGSPGKTRKPVAQALGGAARAAGGVHPAAPAAPPTGFSNFRGIPDDSNNPPDPVIAAGPSNVVVAVNLRIDVYSKVGTQLSDKTFSDFFAGEGQPAQDNLSDPWVVYDPYLGRFWLVLFSLSDNPNRSHVLLALSNSSDATAGWRTFTLDTSLNGNTDSGLWCDYEKLGFDTQAIYLTCNMQTHPEGNDHFQYAKIRVLTKSEFLSGPCCLWWDFWNLQEGGLFSDASRTIQPARMYGAADSDGEYLVDAHGHGESGDTLEIWHITNPGNCCGSPQSAPNLDQNGRPVGSYSAAPPARQKGTSATLDVGNPPAKATTTLRYAIWQKGHLSTGQHLACPSVNADCVAFTEVDVSGFPSTSVVNDWVLPPDASIDRFYPSADVSSTGDKTMVYSVSGPNQFAGVSFVHIPPSSACTQCFDNESSIADGLSSYGSSGNQRWGDYSGASADPDGDGVWVSGEFADTNGKWGTEAALTMDRTPTAITYTGPTGASAGDTVNLSANLVAYSPNGPVPLPGDIVTIFVGTQVCNATTDANGTAVCSVTLNQPNGTVQLEAESPGDPTHLPSSTTLNFTIGATGRHAATLTYTGLHSGDFEDEVALAARLTDPGTGQGISLEPINFSVGSQSCSAVTDASGAATCSLVLQQKPGAYSVVASFPGDSVYSPATVSVAFTINKEEVVVNLNSSKAPANFGDSVTFTAAVNGDDHGARPGFRQPTGTVTFRRSTILLAAPQPLDATNNATWTVPLLQVGDNPISATYSGDDYFLPNAPNPNIPNTGTLLQTVHCSNPRVGGTVNGSVDVKAGSTCIDGATVSGELIVEPGAAVYITNSHLNGGVFANQPLAFTTCGSTLQGSVLITGSAKYVLMGDGGDDGKPACAGNTLSAATDVYANKGQVEVGGNTVSGSLIIDSSTGSGPDLESLAPEIEANTVNGSLFCSSNAPAPINDGLPNHVTGVSFDQCSGI